ncbi:MAG: DUF6062 family protein [Ruminococcus sp.]
MKETICTIPINDIFGVKEGCPFCRMYDMLETQYAEFITGSAMMDPETRVQTNKKGFCKEHFAKIAEVGKRLPNALILQTHLQSLLDNYFPENPRSKPDKKKLSQLRNMQDSCYICDRIQNDVEHFLRTVFAQWQCSEEFRKTYREQEFICLDHYRMVTELSLKGLPSKSLADFHGDTAALAKKQLELLIADTSHFCKMFDYQSRGADWGNSKDAIERDLQYLVRIAPPKNESENK